MGDVKSEIKLNDTIYILRIYLIYLLNTKNLFLEENSKVGNDVQIYNNIIDLYSNLNNIGKKYDNDSIKNILQSNSFQNIESRVKKFGTSGEDENEKNKFFSLIHEIKNINYDMIKGKNVSVFDIVDTLDYGTNKSVNSSRSENQHPKKKSKKKEPIKRDEIEMIKKEFYNLFAKQFDNQRENYDKDKNKKIKGRDGKEYSLLPSHFYFQILKPDEQKAFISEKNNADILNKIKKSICENFVECFDGKGELKKDHLESIPASKQIYFFNVYKTIEHKYKNKKDAMKTELDKLIEKIKIYKIKTERKEPIETIDKEGIKKNFYNKFAQKIDSRRSNYENDSKSGSNLFPHHYFQIIKPDEQKKFLENKGKNETQTLNEIKTLINKKFVAFFTNECKLGEGNNINQIDTKDQLDCYNKYTSLNIQLTKKKNQNEKNKITNQIKSICNKLTGKIKKKESKETSKMKTKEEKEEEKKIIKDFYNTFAKSIDQSREDYDTDEQNRKLFPKPYHYFLMFLTVEEQKKILENLNKGSSEDNRKKIENEIKKKISEKFIILFKNECVYKWITDTSKLKKINEDMKKIETKNKINYYYKYNNNKNKLKRKLDDNERSKTTKEMNSICDEVLGEKWVDEIEKAKQIKKTEEKKQTKKTEEKEETEDEKIKKDFYNKFAASFDRSRVNYDDDEEGKSPSSKYYFQILEPGEQKKFLDELKKDQGKKKEIEKEIEKKK
jgi:hypothetical protein